MKKFVQISIAIVMTLTLLMGVFQLAPENWINVGWNSRISAAAPQSEEFAGCRLCAVPDPNVFPDVGWNSGI